MSTLRRTFTTAMVGLSATAAIMRLLVLRHRQPRRTADQCEFVAHHKLAGSLAACEFSPSGDSSPSSSESRSAPYADGEYTVDGEYGTRDSSIGVQLTLEGGEITAVEVTPHATNDTSRELQTRFAEAVPQLVTGRDIDDVSLDRVAGNSNTPKGFNDALEEIKDLAGR